MVSVINQSYDDLSVNLSQMIGYTKTKVYDKELWIFATVSGKVTNKTKPEKLYRRCGFTGDDIWHILKSK